MKQHARLSFDHVQTNSVYNRTNLVTIQNMARPYEDIPDAWTIRQQDNDAFEQLIEKIVHARAEGKPVIWSMGAHVIKNGMSRYVIEMVRNGILTHVSGNGATSIHDFELAFLGETSEDVARSIEDGSFGMWEETGRYMNEAIQQGASQQLGYGQSLYQYLDRFPERFPHYDDCVFVQCQRFGVPYTCHISIGTDIIHQHPIVDFAALGQTSGKDFDLLCQSIAGLQDGGVFLNFGSAISGPELFLKALSLCRNAGLPMHGITAANFDIVPVERNIVYQDIEPEYYYRPRRNFVDRLRELGGEGLLFHGLHQVTIPHLFHAVLASKRAQGLAFPPYRPSTSLNNAKRKLFPVAERQNRFHVSESVVPDLEMNTEWAHAESDEFHSFIRDFKRIHQDGYEVLVNVGGNVIGSGMNLFLKELIHKGYITHLAMNGAAVYQDFELAAWGYTEELMEGALSSGRLGMWQEPGELLHAVLAAGYERDYGYGESLMLDMEQHPEHYPFKEHSLLYACLQQGIPCTAHLTLGTDAIQQHPDVNYRIQGGASGRDFQSYTHTVSRLNHGAFLNFGSTVTGPEVFLKALSIARNLKYAVHHIITANFDIVRLGNYQKKVSYEDWDYYYRPRKNIIHRPTSLGGRGYHFEGLHQETIPMIWKKLLESERSEALRGSEKG